MGMTGMTMRSMTMTGMTMRSMTMTGMTMRSMMMTGTMMTGTMMTGMTMTGMTTTGTTIMTGIRTEPEFTSNNKFAKAQATAYIQQIGTIEATNLAYCQKIS